MVQHKIRLSAVRIEGFRSCERTAFNPSALIGPNGAGKTNILQALTMLRGSARYGYEKELAISRYGILAQFRIGRKNLVLPSTIRYSLDDDNNECIVDILGEWRSGSMDDKRESKSAPPGPRLKPGGRSRQKATFVAGDTFRLMLLRSSGDDEWMAAP